MTIFQIIAIVVCGPIGLWSLTNLLDIYFRKAGKFTIFDAIALAVCTAVILAAFLGVK